MRWSGMGADPYEGVARRSLEANAEKSEDEVRR
jgi:hypothetical protein